MLEKTSSSAVGSVKRFTIKHKKMEIAPLTTRHDFLYECVELSTYSIFPSLKYFPVTQMTFTNNRCSNNKKKKKYWNQYCLFLHLTLFLSVSEIVASLGPNGNPGLSPQSKENIIQHVTLFTSRTSACKREKRLYLHEKVTKESCRCISNQHKTAIDKGIGYFTLIVHK